MSASSAVPPGRPAAAVGRRRKDRRGAVRPDGRQVHLLSVFDVTAGTVRAQREAGAKTNKIRELAPAVAHLDLIGLVTGAFRLAGFAIIAHARRYYGRDDERILACVVFSYEALEPGEDREVEFRAARGTPTVGSLCRLGTLQASGLLYHRELPPLSHRQQFVIITLLIAAEEPGRFVNGLLRLALQAIGGR